jgi:hypothetical protein
MWGAAPRARRSLFVLLASGLASPSFAAPVEPMRVPDPLRLSSIGHERSDCRPDVTLNYNVWASSRCNSSDLRHRRPQPAAGGVGSP